MWNEIWTAVWANFLGHWKQRVNVVDESSSLVLPAMIVVGLGIDYNRRTNVEMLYKLPVMIQLASGLCLDLTS